MLFRCTGGLVRAPHRSQAVEKRVRGCAAGRPAQLAWESQAKNQGKLSWLLSAEAQLSSPSLCQDPRIHLRNRTTPPWEDRFPQR